MVRGREKTGVSKTSVGEMGICSGNCKQGGWDAGQASVTSSAGQAVAYVAGSACQVTQQEREWPL